MSPAGTCPNPTRFSKFSESGTVAPIAGSGSSGYSGDGGPAISAQFNGATGIAIDKRSGTLYVADQDNHRVRAIYSTGTIQTVAGTGVPGFSGDGGLGVTAQLRYPSGVAVDATGNVYIADGGNNHIRMLSPAGLITTVGGSGLQDEGPYPFTPPGGGLNAGKGDGGPGVLGSMTPEGTLATDSNGSVYFVEPNGIGNSVRALIPSASTVGCMYSAVPAQVTFPTGGGSNSVSRSPR
jgi:trimeric autotransporter adhesin